MKKFRNLLALVLVVLLVITVAGCSSANTAKEEEPKKDAQFIRIGTASLGGNFFPMGAAIAQVMDKNIPGLKSSAQATGGSAFNMVALEKRELELAVCQGPAVADAIKGKKSPSARTIGNYNATPQHILVRTSAKINNLSELKGKKIELIAAGDGVEVTTRQLLDAIGIKWDEIKPEYSGNRVQAASRLKTGQVDAIIDGTGIGASWMVDLVGDGSGFKFIGLSDDEISKISAKFPEYSKTTIPANAYKGQTTPVKTVVSWTVIVTRADLSDQLIYDMTKQLFANQAALKERHAYFADFKPENIKGAILAPLHPGAEKFYKEKGIL